MNTQLVNAALSLRESLEATRQRQLIEVTIDSLAELGYVGTTLAQITGRAGVTPGLVAHYFGDKDGLMEAAFRSLVRRVADHVRGRLRLVGTPRGRIQAVIDGNLAPEEFSQRTGTAWLAFWGQVLQAPRLKRIQSAYQRRTLSTLRGALGHLVPATDARQISAMIAAMIDGVWLRAALSGWQEADSESARALLTEFVDGRLAGSARMSAPMPAGRGSPPVRGRRFASSNPATGEVLGRFEVAGPGEIDAAIRAARRAQIQWGAHPGVERARLLRAAAAKLRSRSAELADLETRDTGTPLRETLCMAVEAGAQCFEHFAAVAQTLGGEHLDLGPRAFGYTRREPLGVIAGIGTWEYPLRMACEMAAPALACGNALIFNPSHQTPCTAAALEALLLEAGLPVGLFQVLQGYEETGALLASHPGIRRVSTGGAAGEPGGTALIVFADAPLERAVSATVAGKAVRVFVQASVAEKFLERLVARVRALQIGDPLDPATEVGPLVSEAQMRRMLAQIGQASAQGARLVIGGERIVAGPLGKGWFVSPAVFAGCRDDMAIVRAAIAGPLVSLLEFDDEREAVERVNVSAARKGAGVFTGDLARAHRVVVQLGTATCWINRATAAGLAYGNAGVDHHTQLKRVDVVLDADVS